jgi:hypothetical protein
MNNDVSDQFDSCKKESNWVFCNCSSIFNQFLTLLVPQFIAGWDIIFLANTLSSVINSGDTIPSFRILLINCISFGSRGNKSANRPRSSPILVTVHSFNSRVFLKTDIWCMTGISRLRKSGRSKSICLGHHM